MPLSHPKYRDDTKIRAVILSWLFTIMPGLGTALAVDLTLDRLEQKIRLEYDRSTRGLGIPEISARELLNALGDSNLVLVDVRKPEEQAVSMLPGAMTTGEFADKFRRGVPSGTRIVVYCTIGYRSGKFAAQLASKHDIKALNLKGGLLAWSHVQGPLVSRDASGQISPTRRVHVYDKDWNFLHPDFEAVW